MIYGRVQSQFHAFITLILDGGEVSFTPWMLLSLGKEHLVTNDRRLDGPYSKAGWCGEEKNLLPLLGIKSDSSTIQLAASRYTD
jgi:hypothetical protein